MALLVEEIRQLYQQTFGSKPHIVVPVNKEQETPFTGIPKKGSIELSAVTNTRLKEDYLGVEIWLPLRFLELPKELFPDRTMYLPYSVVRVASSSNWIETPLAERRGTVKELYNIGDYYITVKGFFIDKENRSFPDADLNSLKKLYEMGVSFKAENALINAFLEPDDRLVLKSFDLPEVEGGRKSMRPFILQLTSDSIFELELK